MRARPLAGLAAGAIGTVARTWGAAGWLSDVVPHVVYGLVTALAFDAIASERR